MTLLRDGAIIGVLVYGAMVLYMYLVQRRLLYRPENKGLTPAAAGLIGVETLQLKAKDDTALLAWHAAAPAGRPTIVYFQGNAGEIGDRIDRLRYYRERGYGVLYLSYRGFGGSAGSPTETGLISDAAAAHDWLTAHGVSADRLALVGESLGSGVAVQLAARHKVGAIALEAPYTSTADVAVRAYWWLPVRLLMKDQFRSIDHIRKIGAPLLILHGTLDPVVPFDLGQLLFEAASEPKEFVAIEGGDHGSIFSEPTWAREIDFFDRHLVKAKASADRSAEAPNASSRCAQAGSIAIVSPKI